MKEGRDHRGRLTDLHFAAELVSLSRLTREGGNGCWESDGYEC